MTFEQIKELVELVSERGLQGMELERSGFRLKIDGKPAPPAPVYSVLSAPAPAPVLAASAAAPALPASPASPGTAAAPSAAPAPAAEPAASPGAGAHILNSPIVGTFYRSPSPDAGPFVEVGARVKKGQVVCIIEAMKLMNEIESDVDGVVVEVYPQNAQAVEFSEPLFAIRTS
ncbi:MAG TPA: acetyl-CoA carboxylase biotin carboxyl carrier protein [Thermoanaerobaculia bacterium]|nr:acetyl-CoA carboxylase biotin carboxyl carrier protein [Thermoanaerobaculia bacterium]